MEPVIQAELIQAFGDEVEHIVLPNLEEVQWEAMDYLGWVHPAGRLGYVALVSPQTGVLTGSVLQRSRIRSSKPRFEMCSWCRHVHNRNGTAMFSISVKGTGERHRLGQVLCKDLDCSLRLRNLVEPASYMSETLYLEARIWRMQMSMHRWLRKANRL